MGVIGCLRIWNSKFQSELKSKRIQINKSHRLYQSEKVIKRIVTFYFSQVIELKFFLLEIEIF